MAELSRLDDALGEAMGRARASRRATSAVGGAVTDRDIAETLAAVRNESAEIARRIDAVVQTLDGRKTAIREHARDVSRGMRGTAAALGAGDDGALRGLEALAVDEAAELANLEVLCGLALAAADGPVSALVEWALPLQERHLADLRDAGLVLAAQVDPAAPA
jgi:hypothetical protein